MFFEKYLNFQTANRISWRRSKVQTGTSHHLLFIKILALFLLLIFIWIFEDQNFKHMWARVFSVSCNIMSYFYVLPRNNNVKTIPIIKETLVKPTEYVIFINIKLDYTYLIKWSCVCKSKSHYIAAVGSLHCVSRTGN